MLNIDDINERLANNPEPKFVRDVRKNIINTFSKLEFIEEGHKYYVNNDDGSKTELPSVSHVCHRFQEPVDWDEIALNKANRLGIDVKDLKREWKENNIRSTSNGTKTHLFAEAYMYFFRGKPELMPEVIKETQYQDGYLIPYGKKEEAVVKFYEDIYKIKNIYPVMAEAQIYTGVNDMLKLSTNYSGTFDMLFAYKLKNKWKLGIFDWKTNASLENNYNQTFQQTLLPPFNYLIDESKSIYTIQLSAYQLGISQLGYEIADRKIIWLKDDGTYEKISVEDVSNDLKSALT